MRLIPPFAPALRVRLGRPGAGVADTSSHRLSLPGVSSTSPSVSSPSSSCPDKPNRLAAGVASSALRRENDDNALGGDGVESGADEGAVVWDDDEGIRSFLAGVENAEPNELKEKSGWVPMDWADVSGRLLSAADILLLARR